MKRMLQCMLLAVIVLAGTAYAQDFTQIEPEVALVFESRFHVGAVAHGIAVDNDGRVWIAPFGTPPEGVDPGIHVLNPDGTPAAFSPIASVTVGAETIDTGASARGISVDHEGHIIYAIGGRLLRINSETGEGMSAWAHPAGSALTRPGVDDDGYAYVSMVAGAPVIFVLDIGADFSETTQIEDEEYPSMWTRAQEVDPSGSPLITALLGGGLIIWESEDLVNYTPRLVSTNVEEQPIFGGDASSLAFDPDGMLWVTDEGFIDTEEPENSRPHGLHVFDLDAETYYTLRHDSLSAGPRGVAFYQDGDDRYIYVTSFVDGLTTRFQLGDPTSSEVETRPVAFRLDQNYPNPFNPSTTISYTMERPGAVSLRIFDVTGRQVATLIDGQQQAAGTHTITWNALGAAGQVLPSGTYLYQLEADGQRITKAMILLK